MLKITIEGEAKEIAALLGTERQEVNVESVIKELFDSAQRKIGSYNYIEDTGKT